MEKKPPLTLICAFMADFSEKCFSCLKPKNRAAGGFVTQFIDFCRCAEVQEERPADFEPLPTCNICRQSINQRLPAKMSPMRR
jgi:hypothetical protein